MNFLAHQHLSYPIKDEMLGNFIGDYVKGKKYLDYPEAIANGIVLHRKIDSFTDHHPQTLACKQLFAPYYGRYAGVVVDMVYDYALAYHWEAYSSTSLEAFSQEVYQNLFDYYEILPQRVQAFLPRMKKAQRLQSYARASGIVHAIDLMSHYTSLPDKGQDFKRVIQNCSEKIFQCFSEFYPDVQQYVQHERNTLKIP